MRALTVLVIVMGVMIAAGFATLVVIIVGRISHPAPSASPAATLAAPPIELPAGARVETMAVGPDRIVLNIVLPDGGRRLVIIDLASGRRLGTIPLQAAP